MSSDIREQIRTSLAVFGGADLRSASIGLLNSLGYQSEKTLDLDNTPDAFLAEFDKRDRKFRKNKALFERWKSVEFLFQITDDEVQSAGGQGILFDSGYDHGNYQSYLFFALDLEKNHYTRTRLADITREINLLFDMPAMLIIRHNGALTFSIIDRRLHKKDQSRDVLEKVKLIKDIRYQDPHRAHIEILYDLALPTLMAKHECRDFKQLHEAWRTTLDTNELNKKFYRELADWYFWALDHVEFPADVEKDTATRNATSVIRLLTRLIFCWFLKEKGLIPADLFSERKLSAVLKSLKDEDSSFYRAILQNLFFGTLNQRMNTGGRDNRRFANDGSFLERKDEYGVKNLYRYQKLFAISEEEAVNLFSGIPFLNGGLFDCLDKEDDSDKRKVIYVDGFTRNPRKQPKVPNFLFFSDYRTLDLSDAYGDKKRKKEKVRGLINLLDSYKFTVTENTPIEEEIALDPELLGKVFENLLASYNPETGTTARKQTGSFYRPREIVNYMVDESLIAYLEGRLKAMVPKLAEMKDLQDLLRDIFAYTERVHPFDEDEVEALIDAIDTCKILDPACGSGAFPMGILHKLVFILGKLDPNNDRWKEKQIAKAEQIPDVSAREIAVGAIEKDFESNDLNYGRKLYLIENCIYGVDIQPIAIQISKLRFFISLICDQRTNKNKAQNCGVRPLPNLETKFVAANTLVSLDRGQDQLLLTDPRLPKLERELAAIRHKHFAAQRRRDKLALQRRDAEIRKEIAVVLAGSMSVEASHQLAAWDPYDQNTFAPFFDAEWMYGIMDGFDVVIANPPYLKERDNKAVFDEIKNTTLGVQYHEGKMDYWFYFLHRAFDLADDRGIVTYITSRYWITSSGAKKLRQRIRKVASIVQVLDIGKLKVFDTVAGHHMVHVYLYGGGTANCTIKKIENSLDGLQTDRSADDITISHCPSQDLFTEEGEIRFERIALDISGVSRLGDEFHVSQGVVQNPDKVSAVASRRFGIPRNHGVFVLTKDELESLSLNRQEGRYVKPFYDEACIRKYFLDTTDEHYLLYLTKKNCISLLRLPHIEKHLRRFRKIMERRRETRNGLIEWFHLHWPRDPEYFEEERIVMPSMFTEPRAALIRQVAYFGMGSNIIVARRRDVSLCCLTGILNSRIASFWFRTHGKQRGAGVDIGVERLRSFPIPRIAPHTQHAIETIVEELAGQCRVSQLGNLKKLTNRLNDLIYEMYGLHEDEIAIVESWDT